MVAVCRIPLLNATDLCLLQVWYGLKVHRTAARCMRFSEPPIATLSPRPIARHHFHQGLPCGMHPGTIRDRLVAIRDDVDRARRSLMHTRSWLPTGGQQSADRLGWDFERAMTRLESMARQQEREEEDHS